MQLRLFPPIFDANNTDTLHNTMKSLYQHCRLTIWVNPNILKPTGTKDSKLCLLTIDLKTQQSVELLCFQRCHSSILPNVFQSIKNPARFNCFGFEK